MNLDFNDLLAHFKLIRRMGPAKKVMRAIPGLERMLPPGALNHDEKRLNRDQAIIRAMTPEERAHPEIINDSRRRRIVRGSGTSVEEVSNLLTYPRG